MKKPTYDDLDNDPVYLSLKANVLPGYELLGGRIKENKIVGPKQPRTLIEIEVKRIAVPAVAATEHTPAKPALKEVTRAYNYNYKKMLREIKSSLRKENR